jgi:hypothetical protein
MNPMRCGAAILTIALFGNAVQRIVSINICGDLLALSLAPRAHIASITFLAADEVMSPIAELAEGVPRNYGMAEEVLALDPDLVLAGRYTARATVNLLKRLGYTVLEFDIAESMDDARAQIRVAAAAMGVIEAGENMIAKLDARIQAARPRPGQERPLAVVYGPNGFTLGPHSLSGSLIEIAGFENLAARAGILRVGQLPLEQLLLAAKACTRRPWPPWSCRTRLCAICAIGSRWRKFPDPCGAVRARGWRTLWIIWRLRAPRCASAPPPETMTTPASALSPSPDGGNGPSGPSGMARYLLVLAFLGLLTAGLFVASLFTGRSPGTLLDLFLGLAGAALQGYLRNPLAEPGLVGASSTAALGAVLMLYTGASTWFPMALPLGGIAGAIIGLALVTLLAGSSSGALTLILAGVAINTLAAALTSLALNLAPSPYAALEIIFWLLGSLADRSFEHLRVALPFMLVGWALMLRLGRALDALSIGEEAASSLGFRLSRLRLLLLLGVGLSVGAAVAVSGAIGFIPEPSASSAWWCHIFCAPWWATVPARCCRRAHWAAPP